MSPTIRAEALFASPLQPSALVDRSQLDAAIAAALATHGGPVGCAAVLAAEYGEHPEVAASRMRWALSVLADGAGR